jgi:hypothetical protein
MIAFDNGDEIYAIYCHHDGYPSGVGKTLFNHYDDIEKVEELMDLGNLSILGEEIGVKHDFDDHDPDDKGCLAYGRDRGEENQEAGRYISLLEATYDFDGCAYYYLFDGHGWLWKGYKGAWKQLTVEDTH